MKKGQSGVSLIALVITIIVVIILAAVAFGTSTRTITNANYSTFTNAVGEVRTALMERVTTVKGEEAAKGRTRTDAQVYNYVAKNGEVRGKSSGDSGDNDSWLSRGYANTLEATRIEPEVIKDVLGLKNLNTIKVNTDDGQGIEVSYFVTRSGDVFVWPPYEYENKYYVNDDKSITVTGSTATSIPFTGVTVNIDNNQDASSTPAGPGTTAPTASTKTVYWKDKPGANSPRGWESNGVYSDGSKN